MPTLRDIRRRINAVRGTSKITQAMKMVSAARLRRAQKAIINARPYVGKMEAILSNLIEAVGNDYSHTLINHHKDINSIAVVVVSSDRGLCGSFNTNLFRTVRETLKNEIKVKYPQAEISLIPVGKKSVAFFKKSEYKLSGELQDIFSKLDFTHAKKITDILKENFISGKFDKVYIFYNAFVNLIKQLPTQKVLLPIAKEVGNQKSDVKIKASDTKSDTTSETSKYKANYIFEPEKEEILNELLPKLLDIQVWRTLLESSAAEQAARMMAMDNATTNALDLIDHLELIFNKARQAMITKEMLEIVSGAEALKSS